MSLLADGALIAGLNFSLRRRAGEHDDSLQRDMSARQLEAELDRLRGAAAQGLGARDRGQDRELER